MATPSEKLAESLEVLHKLQNANGAAAIRARDLTRTHRERLLKNGFLQEVMKGWYIPSRSDRVERDGLRMYRLEAALIEAAPRYFVNHATDARAAMAMIRDASDLLGKLLDGGHSTIAGRLAAGFRNCGRGAIADEIIAAMIAAGYAMRESDPFSEQPVMTLTPRETSPYVNRIKLLWQKMRGPVT